MNREDFLRASGFVGALDLLPPILRNELIADRQLNRRYGTVTEAVLMMGNGLAEFKRSALIRAIREATRSIGAACELADASDGKWTVTASLDPQNSGIVLKSDRGVFQIDDFSMVGESTDLRLSVFDSEARRYNLPEDITTHWRTLITSRPLEPDELVELTDEFRNTPVSVSRLISDRYRAGGLSLNEIVPASLPYFERLVGKYEGSADIQEYASESLAPFVKKLFETQGLEGVKFALLLGIHARVVAEIGKLPLTGQDLTSLLDWAIKSGDVVARTGLVEIAFMRPDLAEEIRASLGDLLAIFSGAVTEKNDQCVLFSAAFNMIYGEISVRRILDRKPVFWRRLSAAAQASMIIRRLPQEKIDLRNLVDWMKTVRAQPYLLQCLFDMRTDPRWAPEFSTSDQFGNEFRGRIISAATAKPETAEMLGVSEIILGDECSLKSRAGGLLAWLAGPLEGNIQTGRELGDAEIEQLRAELVAAAPVASSFSSLVNLVFFVKAPEELGRVAAEAIQRAQYKLDSAGDPDVLGACLIGLAGLAAIMKCTDLTDALVILIRNYRRNFADELPIPTALRIGFVASASHAEFKEWSKAVGFFVNDFAFGKLTKEETLSLHYTMKIACQLVPELWASCGQGIAALEAGLS
ncbi:MAG TPA: hypothetical protein VIM56_07355 [Rhizomicrobium sp.]